MTKVLIVGDKPSKTNTYRNVAFVGAKCYSTLVKWCTYLKIDIIFSPMLNSHTKKQLTIIKYLYQKRHYKVVAMGLNASKRLKKLNIEHYVLPHPSGLNRRLNCKKYVANKLNECYSYIHGNKTI